MISKTINASNGIIGNLELKRNIDNKMMATTSRLSLDPLKPLENVPKTTESPKGGAYRNK